MFGRMKGNVILFMREQVSIKLNGSNKIEEK
jgi:hypothetical protein